MKEMTDDAYLCTYGVRAMANGSLTGMQTLLQTMAKARFEPFPINIVSIHDGGFSGSSVLEGEK